MRQRDKARIWRRFIAGESVWQIFVTDRKNMFETYEQIESILREGLRGAFDPMPQKQARAYARAAGVKVGKVVKV